MEREAAAGDARRRTPAAPPDIAGFTPIELIGSGGYADVYLYEQHSPRRQVAVKVLIAGSVVGESRRASFTVEADLMARVSAHPFIVQIFQADIARDGRPYFVMEYYPNPNLAVRARKEQMSVAEVLRVGVQLASAVETAHRNDIFHRDIKPANILTSEFHRPGLTDFGIASAQGPNADSTEGLSIPWSPPESFSEAPLDARADVYSLAATLYTLLAGRSPFEISGGDNTELALISRIEHQPVPPIGRADVPGSLERLLASAMAKSRTYRPASALAFARLLQGVEDELRLGVTPLELAGGRTPRVRDEVVDDDATSVKAVREVQAQEPRQQMAQSGPNHLIDAVPSNPNVSGTAQPRRRELLDEPEVEDTRHHRDALAEAPSTEEASRSKRWTALIGAAATLVVAVVIGALALGSGGGSTPDVVGAAPEVNDGFQEDASTVVRPEVVAEVTGSPNSDGTFSFTWEAPAGEGLRFAVTEEGSDRPELTEGTTYVASTSCVEVETVAPSGLVSPAVRGCAG